MCVCGGVCVCEPADCLKLSAGFLGIWYLAFAAFDASWEVHVGSDGLFDFTESAISKIKMTPFQ